MNYKLLISSLILLAAGIAIGRYTLPAKVITKVETKEVTHEATKTVEVDKTDYYKNKVLVEITTTKPDGTVIRERKFIDKSIINRDDKKNTDEKKDSEKDSKKEESKTYNSNSGSVRALIARNTDRLSEDIYGIHVEKRIVGPFTLGAFGLTDKTLGLSLGMNF